MVKTYKRCEFLVSECYKGKYLAFSVSDLQNSINSVIPRWYNPSLYFLFLFFLFHLYLFLLRKENKRRKKHKEKEKNKSLFRRCWFFCRQASAKKEKPENSQGHHLPKIPTFRHEKKDKASESENESLSLTEIKPDSKISKDKKISKRPLSLLYEKDSASKSESKKDYWSCMWN